MNNNVTRYCPEVDIGEPIKFAGHLLSSGYTSFEILVKDITPAEIQIIRGPTTGTTGDPLGDEVVVEVVVTDNNPYAQLTDLMLVEDHFLHDGDYVVSGFENIVYEEIEILRATDTAYVIDENADNEMIKGMRGRFEFEFAQPLDYRTRLPDNYAKTMPNYSPVDFNRPLQYYAQVTVDDGQIYDINSAMWYLEVTDNDAPELYFQLKTRPEFIYEIEGGVRDTDTNPAPITINLNGEIIENAFDPFKQDETQPLIVQTADFCPEIFTRERIFYSIYGVDNVDGRIQGEFSSAEPLFVHNYEGSEAYFMFERQPEVNPVLMKCQVTDQAGNTRELHFYMTVNERSFTPRVLESEIRGR